jgi:hypothetical protein
VYHLIFARGKYHDEDISDIGIFSSKPLAQETAMLLKRKPDFKKGGRFRIYERVIDRFDYMQKNWLSNL